MRITAIILWAVILVIDIVLWFYGLIEDYDAHDLVPLQIWLLCTSIIVLYIITQ